MHVQVRAHVEDIVAAGDRINEPSQMLGAAATPLVLGGLKTVILAAVRRRTARFSGRRHQASGMWSFAL